MHHHRTKTPSMMYFITDLTIHHSLSWKMSLCQLKKMSPFNKCNSGKSKTKLSNRACPFQRTRSTKRPNLSLNLLISVLFSQNRSSKRKSDQRINRIQSLAKNKRTMMACRSSFQICLRFRINPYKTQLFPPRISIRLLHTTTSPSRSPLTFLKSRWMTKRMILLTMRPP